MKDCGKQAGSGVEISEKRVESSQKYRGRGRVACAVSKHAWHMPGLTEHVSF